MSGRRWNWNGIDQPRVEHLLDINDKARIEYNRVTYGVDPLDSD